MLDDFLVRAALAGTVTALAAGPLGCFVVWRRMAYFGDATAHASILGVALALGFSFSIFWGTLGVAALMALFVSTLAGRALAVDTTLGVLAHGALALGLVTAALVPGGRVDLSAYLFGDLLAVSKGDLGLIGAGAIAVIALLAWRWRRLVTATVSEELAFVSGIDPRRERVILMLALAIVVAVAIKVVGALLITALLIVPAAAARGLSSTPERMAIAASGLGVAAALGGLGASLRLDTPVGPSIVAVAVALFAASQAMGARRN